MTELPRKAGALAFMGQARLLLPGWIATALAANDRLKLDLSALQAAAAHAAHPEREPLDVLADATIAPADARYLRSLISTASRVESAIVVPTLPQLAKRLADDLALMARPVIESHRDALAARVRDWQQRLAAFTGDELSDAQLHALTRGDPDSFHRLVMDLHKELNALASTIATEDIDGAHVWQVEPADRGCIAAFMRGLNRTAALKFAHPGLSTAATRDGDRLLLQNDIGENDVHVLIVEVRGLRITLRYSDLHRARFEFFRWMLEPYGAAWETLEQSVDATLNDGRAFTFGTASFDCADEAARETVLDGIGSRIVFLIDWNRARKRLLPFVDKADAIAILKEAARTDAGHMAWLLCGGDALVYAAMQAVGADAFRIGDRLDAVLGAADAKRFLVDVLRLASDAMLRGEPGALVADETQLLLARHVRRRSSEFELLEEHAAYCHALAQAVSDCIEHRMIEAGGASAEAVGELAARAKSWERQADHLVMRAREKSQRQPRWRPIARLVELSDDIADALEEATFLMSVIVDGHRQDWSDEVHEALAQLSRAVLGATQEHVKALAIAHDASADNDALDSDPFVAATWNVLRSERQCDELLRQAKRTMLATLREPGALMLANELAATLELASDRLLAASYALRDLVFGQAGDRR